MFGNRARSTAAACARHHTHPLTLTGARSPLFALALLASFSTQNDLLSPRPCPLATQAQSESTSSLPAETWGGWALFRVGILDALALIPTPWLLHQAAGLLATATGMRSRDNV